MGRHCDFERCGSGGKCTPLQVAAEMRLCSIETYRTLKINGAKYASSIHSVRIKIIEKARAPEEARQWKRQVFEGLFTIGTKRANEDQSCGTCELGSIAMNLKSSSTGPIAAVRKCRDNEDTKTREYALLSYNSYIM